METVHNLDRIVDIDNHYYETDDAFTRHLPKDYTGPALHVERDSDGGGRLYFGDTPNNYLREPPTDRMARPGMFATDRDDRVSAELSGDDVVQPRNLGYYMDHDERIRWMDDHNIETSVLWPSLGLTVEQQFRSDPAACVANLRSFNRWIDEEWGFDYKGRIMATPFLTLVDIDDALAELDYVLDRGARLVHLLYAPVAGRSLGDPFFDPFWTRLERAGIPFAFHAGNAGYTALLSTNWGEQAEPSPEELSAFQRYAFWVERAITDTVGALILHNLYGRFPGLQTVVVELGSEWVPSTLHSMDSAARAARGGRWLGGPVTDKPSDVFSNHFSVMPFIDEDIRLLVDTIGADRVLLGSDFPHPEGLADPWRFVDECGLKPDEISLVARQNSLKLLGR